MYRKVTVVNTAHLKGSKRVDLSSHHKKNLVTMCNDGCQLDLFW